MDHVVYVDAKEDELRKILDGSKTMIIRGALGRKMPYGRVFEGDTLYLIENNADGKIKAKVKVKSVFNSERMTQQQSMELVDQNQSKLVLTDRQYDRWSRKRYIVLIEITAATAIENFTIDKSNYGNMDDWLPVKDINSVKVGIG